MQPDQAEGLRRLMAGTRLRHVAVLEPGRDSGVVAVALAGALARRGLAAALVRAGRSRAYLHAPAANPVSWQLAREPGEDVAETVCRACAVPPDLLLASAQAESWQAAPGLVTAAGEVVIVVHARQEPAQTLAWVYASLKALGAESPVRVRVGVRAAANAAQALAIHARIAHVSSRYLGMAPGFAGHVPLALDGEPDPGAALADSLLRG
ncbi:hypothetical protein FOZ76_09820 [Verticiella sediminum]|uniref:Uncharacterized protein n=1 Tax=Verticiella sediminum TaxID=1247510 RepID=A0A556ARY5_9BURK|nr:hypothetical protein [Verticiella sediminum]TSH95688.1 hypothetical protein FOZ76_09820 [Verticiella sediminum]